MHYKTYRRADFCPALPKTETDITLTEYTHHRNHSKADTGKRWGVLVIPGGGYQMCAPTEGEPVALEFYHKGCEAFVLNYSTKPATWPQILLEAAAAIAFIRKKADKYGIAPDRIAVCGASAGAHLAAFLSTHYQLPLFQETLGLSAEDVKPNAAILSYPVTRPDDVTAGLYATLFGPDWANVMPREQYLTEYVGKQNPPTFLWATCTDNMVPPANTLDFASALNKAGVPFEVHMFSEGPHAMGLCTAETAYDEDSIRPRVAVWHDLCTNWLFSL